jgi:TPR repeat protein
LLAVEELQALLGTASVPLALAAREALERLLQDDSKAVSAAASSVLQKALEAVLPLEQEGRAAAPLQVEHVQKQVAGRDREAAASGKAVQEQATSQPQQARQTEVEGDAADRRRSADEHNDLGLKYREGNGVTQSDTEAAKWFRLAANRGHANAQNNLGVMYHQGRGVPQSDTEGLKWFRLAADQGNALGQSNLGFMYENGRGVPKDLIEAVKWYRLAAKQGEQYALQALERLGQASP